MATIEYRLPRNKPPKVELSIAAAPQRAALANALRANNRTQIVDICTDLKKGAEIFGADTLRTVGNAVAVSLREQLRNDCEIKNSGALEGLLALQAWGFIATMGEEALKARGRNASANVSHIFNSIGALCDGPLKEGALSAVRDIFCNAFHGRGEGRPRKKLEMIRGVLLGDKKAIFLEALACGLQRYLNDDREHLKCNLEAHKRAKDHGKPLELGELAELTAAAYIEDLASLGMERAYNLRTGIKSVENVKHSTFYTLTFLVTGAHFLPFPEDMVVLGEPLLTIRRLAFLGLAALAVDDADTFEVFSRAICKAPNDEMLVPILPELAQYVGRWGSKWQESESPDTRSEYDNLVAMLGSDKIPDVWSKALAHEIRAGGFDGAPQMFAALAASPHRNIAAAAAERRIERRIEKGEIEPVLEVVVAPLPFGDRHRPVLAAVSASRAGVAFKIEESRAALTKLAALLSTEAITKDLLPSVSLFQLLIENLQREGVPIKPEWRKAAEDLLNRVAKQHETLAPRLQRKIENTLLAIRRPAFPEPVIIESVEPYEESPFGDDDDAILPIPA